MTTPPDPQPPEPPGPPEPSPPPEPQAPGPEPGTDEPGNGQGEPGDVARLTAALDHERHHRQQLQDQLTALQQQTMTDQERAVASARAEGRAEAAREAGLRVAEASFIAQATGRLADPAAAVQHVNLAPYVADDGQVSTADLGRMVDRLAAATGPAAGGPARVPAGPRQPAGEDDFLRMRLR